jgi:hypothetical protein
VARGAFTIGYTGSATRELGDLSRRGHRRLRRKIESSVDRFGRVSRGGTRSHGERFPYFVAATTYRRAVSRTRSLRSAYRDSRRTMSRASFQSICLDAENLPRKT